MASSGDGEKEDAVVPPLEAMEPWEAQLWMDHKGTWTSHYTVRDSEGNILDEYDAVNEINLDLAENRYAQRNTYTRKVKNAETGELESVVENADTRYWDGKLMIISGRVLQGTAVASTDASRRVLTLNFRTTEAHPMGPGFETFELITLGEKDRTRRARCMQHWNSTGELATICSVFGEKRIRLEPAIYGKMRLPPNGNGKRPLHQRPGAKVRNPRTGECDCKMAMATAVDVETMAGELRMARLVDLPGPLRPLRWMNVPRL